MTWTPLRSGRFGAHPTCVGADALLLWADATRFRDFRRADQAPPREVPVLCELEASASMTAFDGMLRGRDHRVSSAGRYCSAVLDDSTVARLHRGLGAGVVRRVELQLPIVPVRPEPPGVRVTLRSGRPQDRPRAGGRLLLGVIDSGCPFAHRSLRRDGGGTRLLALWHQGDEAVFGSGGRRPADFGYGTEVRRPALDALIGAASGGDCVDEDACYRRAGLRALRCGASHGAAVLDLLAGPLPLGERILRTADDPPRYRRAADPASKADIVFVDLPRESVQDSSSGGLGRWVLDGLRYIVGCAGPLTRRIVVTVSNGTSRSSHDGRSLLERAMAALVAEQKALGRELRIVVAAGNDRDEERHAQIDRLAAGRSATLTLRVPPGSEAPTWVTVRVPVRAHGLTLELLPPAGGPASGRVKVGAAVALGPADPALAIAGLVFPPPAANEAGLALVVIGPTHRDDGLPRAPSGAWTLRITAGTAIREPVHGYISRNQQNVGALPRGLQARFVSEFEAYSPQRWRREAEYDSDRSSSPRSTLRREGTLNGIATLAPGNGVVVAGSVEHHAPAALAMRSRYSSIGPSAAAPGIGRRTSVDAHARTDLYRGLPGIVVAGSTSGRVVRMMGTSFAAPQVARSIARHDLRPRSSGARPPRKAADAPVVG